jgi:L-glyceraldehyde 3-phosphate reductase
VYNMFNRWVEDGLLGVLAQEGIGCIAFSPLAQGLLTDRYLEGIPPGSRASKPYGFLKRDQVTPEKLATVRALATLARARNQSMAQLALAWVLRQPGMTSVLVGASSVRQLEDNVAALDHLGFREDELQSIDRILRDAPSTGPGS